MVSFNLAFARIMLANVYLCLLATLDQCACIYGCVCCTLFSLYMYVLMGRFMRSGVLACMYVYIMHTV